MMSRINGVVGLMPSPGNPNTVSTPQLMSRSMIRSATVFATIFETVARAPGCPQKMFIVQCGSEPLRQEGNTMCGPGEYRPDPSAGITTPTDLPQPELVPYSRNDLRQ